MVDFYFQTVVLSLVTCGFFLEMLKCNKNGPISCTKSLLLLERKRKSTSKVTKVQLVIIKHPTFCTGFVRARRHGLSYERDWGDGDAVLAKKLKSEFIVSTLLSNCV